MGPGRSGSTFLYRSLNGRGGFASPAIKDAYYYRSPRRFERALRRIRSGAQSAILLDVANRAWRDPWLLAGVEELRRRGRRVLLVVLLREHRERAVGLAMTTPLGAGDARWRLGGPAGPVDTVYLGVFRRDALEEAGGFDAALARNQDYELNWRLRERGRTVWFDPALEVAYRPRGSLAQLARQYYDYGWWKRAMLRRHPASLRRRQLAAPLLVSGLAGSALLRRWARRRRAGR